MSERVSSRVLRDLATAAGLAAIRVEAVETPTIFSDFDNYWRAFNLGAGPAPAYCASLSPEKRKDLRATLEARLPTDGDGAIHPSARAWAVEAAVKPAPIREAKIGAIMPLRA